MTQPALTGARKGAFVAYRWALLVFLVLGVVQIFLAGTGVFSLHGREIGTAGETAFSPHRAVGFTMSAVSLVILILALVARPGNRHLIGAAVLFVLTGFAQSLFAGLGDNTAFFGGLHALDGVAVIGLAGFLHASTIRQAKAEQG
jgi:hypothetical protein